MLIPNLDKSESIITLSQQVPVNPANRQISVGDRAVAIFAYNLDKGDRVYPTLILTPPEELCVGRYPMRIVKCGCSDDLYHNNDGSLNNVIVLDVPGRYDLYYEGNRQDDLVLIQTTLPIEADSASIKRTCC